MIKFSRAFWTANASELFERMAYYAIFIVITLYLSNTLGFNDLEASLISGLFSGGLYFLPMFTGAFADKIGYRKAILIAFTLLTIGYLGLGMLPLMLESSGLVVYGEKTQFTGIETSNLRMLIVPIMIILVVGGSFIKSIISASVARETTSETRARGYSIFYMMVNIGAFTGKCFVDPLRSIVGDEAYIYINFLSATLCFVALATIFLFFHSTNTSGQGKSMAEVFKGLGKVFTNGASAAPDTDCYRFLDDSASDVRHHAQVCHPYGWRDGSSGLDSQRQSVCCRLAGQPCHPADGTPQGFNLDDCRHVPHPAVGTDYGGRKSL